MCKHCGSFESARYFILNCDAYSRVRHDMYSNMKKSVYTDTFNLVLPIPELLFMFMFHPSLNRPCYYSTTDTCMEYILRHADGPDTFSAVEPSMGQQTERNLRRWKSQDSILGPNFFLIYTPKAAWQLEMVQHRTDRWMKNEYIQQSHPDAYRPPRVGAGLAVNRCETLTDVQDSPQPCPDRSNRIC